MIESRIHKLRVPCFRITRRRCTGFTLLEVLVCIGVVGILAGLLMPAVQSARESARRTACTNNLRQFGTAIAGYVDVYRMFPGALSPASPYPLGPSWQVQLLPFLGQLALFDQFNGSVPFTDILTVRYSGNHPFGFDTEIATFVCPSDTVSGAWPRSNYRTCFGPSAAKYTMVPPRPGWRQPRGVFWDYHSVRPAEVTDGLQHTVFMSERVMGSFQTGRFDPARDVWFFEHDVTGWENPETWLVLCSQVPVGEVEFFERLGHRWWAGGTASTLYNHIVGPNSAVPDCAESMFEMQKFVSMGARSFHPGSVNALMGDGAVRSVEESIATPVWRAMSTINSGD